MRAGRATVKVGVRVLLVDEDPAVIEPVSQRLTTRGCVTTLAHDGARALALAREQPVDLAVLDVLLPEVNGYQVCRALKALEPAPLVVIHTARAEPADVFWASECGADLFVARPVAPDELVDRLASLLGSR